MNKKTKKKKSTLLDFPPALRGLPNNKWGGTRNIRMRTYGGKFGAASTCRSLSPEEIEEWKKNNSLD